MCPSLMHAHVSVLLTGVKSAESLARRCLRLRADMSHFATNLQYYLMFEVMETAWQVRVCAGLTVIKQHTCHDYARVREVSSFPVRCEHTLLRVGAVSLCV